MDKPETWITWILMLALVYKVNQVDQQTQACSTTAVPGWGVLDSLNSGSTGGVVSGLGAYRPLSGCGCNGTCGGC